MLLFLIVPAALLLLAVAIWAASVEWRKRKLVQRAWEQAIWDRRIRSLELYRQQRLAGRIVIGPPDTVA